MNSIIRDHYELFELYQDLRGQLMDSLSDEDLRYSPGGNNPPLGHLCREMGQVQRSYVDSFQSFRHDWHYVEVDKEMETNVERLKQWYGELDQDLKAVISGLSEEDIQNRTIDRGGGFTVSPVFQLEIYKEALLIFYGKTSVYLKARELPRSSQWRSWIA